MQRMVIKAEAVKNIMENKDITFMRLWDLYNGLLTENQREIANLYFNCDLSLGEIAEQKGVSRQSVSDCLHKCRKQLEEADEKLHFITILDEVCLDYSLYTTRVKRWAEKEKEKHPEWSAELNELLIENCGDEVIIK